MLNVFKNSTNLKDISYAYYNCKNITGSPVCGPNVTNMDYAYSSCYNMNGTAVCGNNVVTMV